MSDTIRWCFTHQQELNLSKHNYTPICDVADALVIRKPINYEAATEMLIVETGMWSKPELFVIAKAHATNIVHAALGGNDEG